MSNFVDSSYNCTALPYSMSNQNELNPELWYCKSSPDSGIDSQYAMNLLYSQGGEKTLPVDLQDVDPWNSQNFYPPTDEFFTDPSMGHHFSSDLLEPNFQTSMQFSTNTWNSPVTSTQEIQGIRQHNIQLDNLSIFCQPLFSPFKEVKHTINSSIVGSIRENCYRTFMALSKEAERISQESFETYYKEKVPVPLYKNRPAEEQIQNASSDIEKEYIKNAVSSQKTKHKREFYRRKVEEMKNLTMAMAKILAVD